MNASRTISPGRPAPPEAAGEREGELRVNVLFTDLGHTITALRTANELAGGLGARIRILVPQVVPYPAPLDSASVPRAFFVRRLIAAARDSRIPTSIQVCVCRERRAALATGLAAGSIVVIGARKRWWWPTEEQKLAAELMRQGHRVVLAGSK